MNQVKTRELSMNQVKAGQTLSKPIKV